MPWRGGARKLEPRRLLRHIAAPMPEPAMTLRIRPYRPEDCASVLAICIAAFTPIHEGFEQALGAAIFERQYHDWKEHYAETLRGIPELGDDKRVYVAEADGAVVGFIFTLFDEKRKTGEIGLNAVAPDWQRRGIGRALYDFALRDLKARGAEVASVGTGGDAAHEPARRAYAAVGFDKSIPGQYLFKLL